MKKSLLISLVLSFVNISLMAQVCTPNSTLQPNQVDPNSETGQTFINGAIGVYYEDVYSIHVPDTFSVLGNPVNVTHIKFLGITGLPAGITAQVNLADSTWLGGTIGCVKISGTPTAGGVFNLSLLQQLLLQSIPTAIPLNNNAYSITISGGSSIESHNADGFDVFTNAENSNSDNVCINIKSGVSSDVNIQIYSVTGQLVYSSQKNISQGINKINIGKNLNSGIYSVRVESENSRVVRKIMIM
jgi:hypothetical protein